LIGCRTGQTAAGPERIALLRFENLTSDPSLDWLSPGLPGTIASQIAGARPTTFAQSQRDVLNAGATQVLTGYYTLEGGALQVTAHLRDVGRNRTLETFHERAEPASALRIASSLASKLTPNPRPFSTGNAEAAKLYWMSTEPGTPPERSAELLQAAVAADPGFGKAHLARIRLAMSAGDVKNAIAYVDEAKKHAGKFPEPERAQLALNSATVSGDAEGRRQALRSLAKVSPEDASSWEALGQSELQSRRYREAVQAFEKAAELRPRDPSVLNLLAYSRAFAGDLPGANAALDAYRKAAPEDANAIDTRGDVHFLAGRFAEAEKHYLEAHAANPEMLQGGDLYRAALARYLAGGVAEADAIFVRFLEYRRSRGDTLLSVREAIWEASTGRIGRALARLSNFASRQDVPAEARDLATAQAAFFELAAGKAPRVEPPRSPNPAVRTLQFFAYFLGQADAPPAEWRKRAASVNPPQISQQLLAFALVINKHFAEAAPLARTIYGSSSPTADADARVLLAWALKGAGQSAEAARLLETWPLPGRMPEPGLGFLITSKLRELKS
jgi:tetratricopeptide (TPR) repeat protein